MQIFKRRMFNSARYLVPHPCRSLQIRSERRDVLTEAKCDFKEEGSPMDHRAFRYRIEELSRKKKMMFTTSKTSSNEISFREIKLFSSSFSKLFVTKVGWFATRNVHRRKEE